MLAAQRFEDRHGSLHILARGVLRKAEQRAHLRPVAQRFQIRRQLRIVVHERLAAAKQDVHIHPEEIRHFFQQIKLRFTIAAFVHAYRTFGNAELFRQLCLRHPRAPAQRRQSFAETGHCYHLTVTITRGVKKVNRNSTKCVDKSIPGWYNVNTRSV